jgi:1,4-alpha-glucan branching enzyme
VLVYARKGRTAQDDLLVILNVAPMAKWDWVIEVSGKVYTKEIFNSDLPEYWGTGDVTNPDIRMEEIVEDTSENKNDGTSGEVNDAPYQVKKYRLTINLPPLAAIVLK